VDDCLCIGRAYLLIQSKRQPKPKRKKPERLAAKLLEIRTRLELSQGGMLNRLGVEDELERDYISKYERGVLEPPLHILLAYARSFGTSTDVLIDDELDLPEKGAAKKRAK
jgi:transcriptional regulator with XRE-family HTH domain